MATNVTLAVDVYGEGNEWDQVLLSKSIAVDPHVAVTEVIRQVKEKTRAGSDDFGLFYPPCSANGMTGTWLDERQTLWHYRVAGETQLEFKLKFRPLRVRILDHTSVFRVQDSYTVGEIIAYIAHEIGLANPEEYGLKPEAAADSFVDWYLPHLNLHSLRVRPQDTVLLMKRLFFYDRWIKVGEEKALQLLYAQLRDAVVAGDLPAHTREEAVEYAAIIFQITFGDHDPSHHVAGFLDAEALGQFFAPKWAGKRGIEADLLEKHASFLSGRNLDHQQMIEEFEFKFCSACRLNNDKLYGLTYFPVDMKVQKGLVRKKFVAEPRLLAIGRWGVFLFDPDDKSILLERKYSELLRWSVSGSKITLDFGDYEDDLVTVATQDAPVVSAYIRDYLDLIQRGDGDPGKYVDPTKPKKEKKEKPKVDMKDVSAKLRDVEKPPTPTPPPIPATEEARNVRKVELKEQIEFNMGLTIGAASQLLMAATADPVNFNANDLLAAANSLDMALNNLLGDVTEVANIEGDAEAPAAVDALAEEVTSMLRVANLAALSLDAGTPDINALSDLLAAADEVGGAINRLIGATDDVVDDAMPGLDDLLNAADMLANAMADLIGEAEAENAPNLAAIRAMSNDATKFDTVLQMSTNALTQDTVEANVKRELAKLQATLGGIKSDLTGMDDLLAAANTLDGALSDMLGAIDFMAHPPDRHEEISEACNSIDGGIRHLLDVIDNAPVKKKDVAAAVKAVVNDSVALGKLTDLEMRSLTDLGSQNELLAAANTLSEALKDLITASSDFGSDQNDANKAKVRDRANDLANASRSILMQRERMQALERLAKHAVRFNATLDMMSAEAREVLDEVRAASRRRDLEVAEVAAAETTDNYLQKARLHLATPTDVAAQKELMSAAGKAVKRGAAVIRAAQEAAKAAGDVIVLEEAADEADDSLVKLRETLRAARTACWSLDMDDALVEIANLKEEAVGALNDLQAGRLTADDADKTQLQAQDDLVDSIEAVEGVVQEMLAAVRASDGSLLGASARGTAHDLGLLVAAARDMAAATHAATNQQAILLAAKLIARKVASLTKACQWGMVHRNARNMEATLAAADGKLSEAVRLLRLAMPGQGDCTHAQNVLKGEIEKLETPLDPATLSGATDFDAVSDQLVTAARALAAAMNGLHGAANESPDALGDEARKIEGVTTAFLGLSRATAALSPVSAKASIIGSAKVVGARIVDALEAARIVGGNNEDQEAPKALSSASAAVGEALSSIVSSLKAATSDTNNPSDAACDAAIHQMHDALALLEASALPPGEGLDLHDTQNELLEAAKSLADETQNLSLAASAQPASVGDAASATADVAVHVARATALAAAAINPSGAGGAAGSNAEPLLNKVEVRDLAKRVTDTIQAMVQADRDLVSEVNAAGGTTDPESPADRALLKSVARAGKAAMAFHNYAMGKVDGLSLDDGQILREHAMVVKDDITTMVRAATAHARMVGDPELKNAFLGEVKNLLLSSRELESACNGLADAEQTSALAAAISSGAPVDLTDGQASLLDACKALLDALAQLTGAAKVVANHPEDQGAAGLLSQNLSDVNQKITDLASKTKFSGPGQMEIDAALAAARNEVGRINGALLNLSVGEGINTSVSDHHENVNDLLNAAKTLAAAIDALTGAASSGNAAEVGTAATAIQGEVSMMADMALAAVIDHSIGVKEGVALLKITKAIIEDVGMVLEAARRLTCDAGDDAAKADAAGGGRVTKDNIAVLVRLIAQVAAKGHDCEVARSIVNKTVAVLDAPRRAKSVGKSLVDYEKDLKGAAKKLVEAMMLLAHDAAESPASLGGDSKDLARTFPLILAAVLGECDLVEDDGAKDSLVAASRALAASLLAMISAAEAIESDPSDGAAAAGLTRTNGDVTDAVTQLLRASKTVSATHSETQDALRMIEEAGLELETSMYLASQNQLSHKATASFVPLSDAVDADARALTAGITTLLQAVTGPRKRFGAAAKDVATGLSTVVVAAVDAASALDAPEAQTALLNATKELCEAISVFVRAAHASNETAPTALDKPVKNAGRAVAAAVASLVTVLNDVAADATLGFVALEEAEAAIRTAVASFQDSSLAPTGDCEALLEPAAAVTAAGTRLYFAVAKPQTVIADRARAFGEVVAAFLAAAVGALADDRCAAMADALRQGATMVAAASLALTTNMKEGAAAREDLNAASKDIGHHVTTLLALANDALREIPEDEDADQQAERELAQAADAIERAAQRLLELNASAAQGVDAAILNESKIVGDAIAELIRAAALAQREIVAEGKQFEGERYNPDPKWSQGLISAAREVVAATDLLVSYAQAYLTGECDESYLVAASQIVNSSTAHLVLAAKAKAKTLSSPGQMALSEAAGKVKKATAKLAKTVSKAHDGGGPGVDDDDHELTFKERLEAQEALNSEQRRLDELRRNLNKPSTSGGA